MSKRIVWFSRHAVLPSQLAELQRLFGVDLTIIVDTNPFSSAEDVVARFKRHAADEMVAVAPLSVLQRLCEEGLRPLWAEMEEVPCGSERSELQATGNRHRHSGVERCYRFVKFRRVVRVRVEYSEIEEDW